jgi:hypothetical protein
MLPPAPLCRQLPSTGAGRFRQGFGRGNPTNGGAPSRWSFLQCWPTPPRPKSPPTTAAPRPRRAPVSTSPRLAVASPTPVAPPAGSPANPCAQTSSHSPWARPHQSAAGAPPASPALAARAALLAAHRRRPNSGDLPAGQPHPPVRRNLLKLTVPSSDPEAPAIAGGEAACATRRASPASVRLTCGPALLTG